MAEPWAPSLAQVADLIPTRTIPTDAVGESDPLGTFVANTTPTDVEARRYIDAAVTHVVASTGVVAVSLQAEATQVAALRAAGMIELAYSVRDADVNIAQQLLAQAKEALTRLAVANTATGSGSTGEHLLPSFAFPAAVPDFDTYPIW